MFVLTKTFTRDTGRVKTVSTAMGLALRVLPSGLLLTNVFLTSYFVSLSVNADMNAVITLAPITVKLTRGAKVSLPFVMTIMINNSFFNSGLSFVSSAAVTSAGARKYIVHSGFQIGSVVIMPTTLIMLNVCVFRKLSISTPPLIRRVR